MIRNSILYHRLWYVKRRRLKNIHIYARLAIVLLILAMTTSFVGRKLVPYLEDISETHVKTALATIVNDAVNNALNSMLNKETIESSLLRFNKDENGRITFIETDIAGLNKLSREISSDIEEKLILTGQRGIAMPSGALLGNSIFADSGPDVDVKILPDGNVETYFKMELSNAGINQTRLCILMQVKIRIKIVAPLVVKTLDLPFSVPVAETIIMGEVPEIRQP